MAKAVKISIMFEVIIFLVIIFIIFMGVSKPKKSHPKKQQSETFDKFEDLADRKDFEESSGINALVEQANEYYPKGDLEQALSLFKQAIDLAPDRHKDALGVWTSVDFACWALFVCLDRLDRIDTDEFKDLLTKIERKSPNTAKEIRGRLKEYEAKQSAVNEKTTIENKIKTLAEQEKCPRAEMNPLLKQFGRLCEPNNEWWRLRDLANELVKAPSSNDFAWSLYNHALTMRIKQGGDLSTIYEPMGHMRQKEGSYFDAAQMFLLAFSQSPKEGNKKQIMICLKKAGFKENVEQIYDELLKKFSGNIQEAIEYFRGLNPQAQESNA